MPDSGNMVETGGKKKFMASQDSRKGLAEVVAPVWLSNIQDSKVQDKLRLGWGRNKI